MEILFLGLTNVNLRRRGKGREGKGRKGKERKGRSMR
jgi:hypothetical protein